MHEIVLNTFITGAVLCWPVFQGTDSGGCYDARVIKTKAGFNSLNQITYEPILVGKHRCASLQGNVLKLACFNKGVKTTTIPGKAKVNSKIQKHFKIEYADQSFLFLFTHKI